MILEDLEHGTTSPLTRSDIIRWCWFAMNDLPEQMVKMHGGMRNTHGFHHRRQLTIMAMICTAGS